MHEQLTIRVYEVVGSGLCVAADDGQKVFNRISEALAEGRAVQLSFNRVENLTSAFLNAAIGQLYDAFTEDMIKTHLQVTDMAADDLTLLKRVVDTAKAYFKDRERFNKARKEALEDDDE